MYTRVLNILTPVNPAQKRWPALAFISIHWDLILRHPIGIIITEAHAHRENARVTGGISCITPRATIKLPLQMIVASIASKIPCVVDLAVISGSGRRF
jgi:hypothetical protein